MGQIMFKGSEPPGKEPLLLPLTRFHHNKDTDIKISFFFTWLRQLYAAIIRRFRSKTAVPKPPLDSYLPPPINFRAYKAFPVSSSNINDNRDCVVDIVEIEKPILVSIGIGGDGEERGVVVEDEPPPPPTTKSIRKTKKKQSASLGQYSREQTILLPTVLAETFTMQRAVVVVEEEEQKSGLQPQPPIENECGKRAINDNQDCVVDVVDIEKPILVSIGIGRDGEEEQQPPPPPATKSKRKRKKKQSASLDQYNREQMILLPTVLIETSLDPMQTAMQRAEEPPPSIKNECKKRASKEQVVVVKEEQSPVLQPPPPTKKKCKKRASKEPVVVEEEEPPPLPIPPPPSTKSQSKNNKVVRQWVAVERPPTDIISKNKKSLSLSPYCQETKSVESDFSFSTSLALAVAFGDTTNIVASSLNFVEEKAAVMEDEPPPPPTKNKKKKKKKQSASLGQDTREQTIPLPNVLTQTCTVQRAVVVMEEAPPLPLPPLPTKSQSKIEKVASQWVAVERHLAPPPPPTEIISKKKQCPSLGPYSQEMKILLVGEGDFSFSASLAVAFVDAPNIVATSLNSIDAEFLKKNYAKAATNITELTSRGCKVIHGVDATQMACHPQLRSLKFDCIVYNFPHAGFGIRKASREEEISIHQALVKGFLKNAKKMINEKDGQIHMTHKCVGFFLDWDLETLGSNQGLRLVQETPFSPKQFPGYATKYGYGGDGNFDWNPSKTYKFQLSCVSLRGYN